MEAGLPIQNEMIIKCEHSMDNAAEACSKLMALPEQPTAICCHSDELAIGVIRQLSIMGKRAGHDIDVVGFDNTSLASGYNPSITSVAIPRHEVGKACVNLVMERIQDINTPNKKIILPHRIVVRESADIRPVD